MANPDSSYLLSYIGSDLTGEEANGEPREVKIYALSNLDTSNVKDMSGTFSDFGHKYNLVLGEKFNMIFRDNQSNETTDFVESYFVGSPYVKVVVENK